MKKINERRVEAKRRESREEREEVGVLKEEREINGEEVSRDLQRK